MPQIATADAAQAQWLYYPITSRKMEKDNTHIQLVIQDFIEGWEAGSGARFAAAFVPNARFVAFDGSVLTGPQEIAQFHQVAFDTHLKGTVLELAIDEIRSLGVMFQ